MIDPIVVGCIGGIALIFGVMAFIWLVETTLEYVDNRINITVCKWFCDTSCIWLGDEAVCDDCDEGNNYCDGGLGGPDEDEEDEDPFGPQPIGRRAE